MEDPSTGLEWEIWLSWKSGAEVRMGGKPKSMDILEPHHARRWGRRMFTHVPGLRGGISLSPLGDLGKPTMR